MTIISQDPGTGPAQRPETVERRGSGAQIPATEGNPRGNGIPRGKGMISGKGMLSGRGMLSRKGMLSSKGVLGITLVGIVVLLGVLGPWLAPYDPNHQIEGANLLPPSAQHWLGTDDVNRDVLSRTLAGVRIDLFVVFLAVPVGALAGVLIGLGTSWFDAADIIAQRIFDVVLAFPTLVLAIALSAVAGPGLWTIAVVIVVIEVPVFGRLTRTSVRTIAEQSYVEAARVVGAGPWWVLRRHVLPNAVEPLIVQLALSMSVAVFIEGAMSFLGIGVQAPAPSLGSLIADGTRLMYDAPFLAVGPLALVLMLVLGLLLISQTLAKEHRG